MKAPHPVPGQPLRPGREGLTPSPPPSLPYRSHFAWPPESIALAQSAAAPRCQLCQPHRSGTNQSLEPRAGLFPAPAPRSCPAQRDAAGSASTPRAPQPGGDPAGTSPVPPTAGEAGTCQALGMIPRAPSNVTAPARTRHAESQSCKAPLLRRESGAKPLPHPSERRGTGSPTSSTPHETPEPHG